MGCMVKGRREGRNWLVLNFIISASWLFYFMLFVFFSCLCILDMDLGIGNYVWGGKQLDYDL